MNPDPQYAARIAYRRAQSFQRLLNATLVATLAFGLASLFLNIAGGLVFPAPALVPRTELDEKETQVHTLPPQAMTRHPGITIRTRHRDWANFRNILRNDVQRHGGWYEYREDHRTAYHVPGSYLERIAPLIKSSGQKPHSDAYAQWANHVLANPPPTPDRTPLADTTISVRHETSVGDNLATRIAFMGCLAAFAACLATAVGSVIARETIIHRADKLQRQPTTGKSATLPVTGEET